MENEEGKNQTAAAEPDLLLQWGNRKRLRFMKMRGEDASEKSNGGLIRKKITSRIDGGIVRIEKEEPTSLSPSRFVFKNSDSATLPNENRKFQWCSPEKEDRYYTTRGSLLGFEDSGKMLLETGGDDKGIVWPRLFISLSSKEKEEDFFAMKGCKLPQRPKKRAKLIQKSLLLVSPGAWLSDLCQERYEVREKKTSKKRRRGLKGMGSMESDSD